MINVFYHPNYIKTKKVFLTRQFKYSIFYNILIDILYFFNFPISNNLIYSGPQKRFNNLIKALKGDKKFIFNKIKFKNSYIVQFDEFGEKILSEILTKKQTDQKILIGPLYNIEYLKKLVDVVNQHDNIKIVTASNVGLKNILNEMSLDINKNKIVSFPSGIIAKKDINIKNIHEKNFGNDCLLYFKKRSESELKGVLNFLKSKDLKFKIFEYGKYKNNHLIKNAKESKFGLILGSTESQGFAIQEMMAKNLPLIVVDKNINKYGGYELSGTTVPYWDDLCGIKVEDIDELEKKYAFFIGNLEKFNPINLVENELTFEVFKENLIKEFRNNF